MRSIIIFIALFCLSATAFADTKWELKRDKEGIKVYAGTVPNSNIKAVRVECVLDASLSQLAALLLNAKAHEQWVYSTKSSYLVKTISNKEQVYYSEMSMPWPITNRDLTVRLKLSQDPVTKVLSVSSVVVAGYVPVNKGIVRVPQSAVNWTVTPLGNNKLRVEYIAQADPGGSVPAWAVNMFCDKGPFETFKKLNQILSAGSNKTARVDFITD